jgi:ribosomal protein S18 acetylase RimI-like enzyme
LGPHVVGQRVVVRRVLPGETGPSGGPAMTDLLGVCTAWGEGRCVVVPESGEPVSIPLRDIVSGKPVPPRPSVRQRVSPRDAELHTHTLWPRVRVEPLGGWLLRTDPAPVGRLRRRANSCLAVGDPGTGIEAAAREVRAFYAALGRPAWAQVERGQEVDHALVAAGWSPVPDGDAHFLVGSLARALRTARRATAPTPGVPGAVAGATEPRVSEDADGVLAEVVDGDGTVLASGRAALDGDWLGMHELVVDPAHRRRGLATAVLAGLLERGAERGATTAWLHVETTNTPALALYEGLGLAVHHTCRYLVAP